MMTKEIWVQFIEALQNRICTSLEKEDGEIFIEDAWVRDEGGGGKSRILTNGNIFEKAGI
jgi:coproporphyrinogen III oxidase